MYVYAYTYVCIEYIDSIEAQQGNAIERTDGAANGLLSGRAVHEEEVGQQQQQQQTTETATVACLLTRQQQEQQNPPTFI